MNQGKELKRDNCPQKNNSAIFVIKDIIPIIIAVLIVTVFSGDIFGASGEDWAAHIVIEVCFIFAIGFVFYILFNKIRKNQSETYISVCENGICGVRSVGVFNNSEFFLSYSQVKNSFAKGDKLFIETDDGRLVFSLEDSENTAKLINELIA